MHFQSKDKTILVIADIHQEVTKLEKILATEKYDQVICLGDWFDSFDHDTDKDVEDTCKLLDKCLSMPNFFTLMGNHDIHYLTNNNETMCSGFEERKRKLIQAFFRGRLDSIRSKFRWFCKIDDYLCTHAGLHIWHLPAKFDFKDLVTWLLEQEKQANLCLDTGQRHWTYRAGMARGGRIAYGGILWLDFNYEFKPIPEVKQIVGHTSQDEVIEKDGNFCIDCHLNQYLVFSNGNIDIEDL